MMRTRYPAELDSEPVFIDSVNVNELGKTIFADVIIDMVTQLEISK